MQAICLPACPPFSPAGKGPATDKQGPLVIDHRHPQGPGAQEVGGTPARADKQVACIGCQIRLRGVKWSVPGCHHSGGPGCRGGG